VHPSLLQKVEQFAFAVGSITRVLQPLKLLAEPWSVMAALPLISCSCLRSTNPIAMPATRKATKRSPRRILFLERAPRELGGVIIVCSGALFAILKS
jgi:hypothetical protein